MPDQIAAPLASLPSQAAEARLLAALERKALWLSAWMIHHANHVRPSAGGLKVGGHQASSASIATIMTALYFAVLRPQVRVAVKPHASPVFHAIQYLLGNQSRAKLDVPGRGRRGQTVDVRGIPRKPVAKDTELQVERGLQVGNKGLELGVPGRCLELQVQNLTGQGLANLGVQD